MWTDGKITPEVEGWYLTKYDSHKSQLPMYWNNFEKRWEDKTGHIHCQVMAPRLWYNINYQDAEVCIEFFETSKQMIDFINQYKVKPISHSTDTDDSFITLIFYSNDSYREAQSRE